MVSRRFYGGAKARSQTTFRMMVLFIFFILLGAYCMPLSLSHLADQPTQSSLMITEGQFLYAPMWATTTYLRESSGVLNTSYPSSFLPGVAVWWLGNGAILRTIRTGSGGGAGGSGGGVQKVLRDGTVVWDFRYNTNGCLTHHDVKTLPNGNVLLIAWETKTRTEAIAAGRNPSYVSTQGMRPDHIIEVQPTGPTSGIIVWEWHVWDHLIQDYDPTKANYGVVADHPELVDINYVPSTNTDWMHTNSIDYNQELDQILLSVHNFNEIWVIDHSTTTAEAAGHTGGNSGKGGDLLYRWGNPAAYRRGTVSNKVFSQQHDATWIKPGYPGEGNILVFNNGVSRPGGLRYSSVDELTPPIDDNGQYYLAPGSAYGPTTLTWSYTTNPPTNFYASHLCGAQRLSNGNTLITNGETGKIFEVTPSGETIWQYNTGGQLFKVVYIPHEEPQPPEPNTPDLHCSGSLIWTKIKPGATVTGSFQVQNIGDEGSLLNWTVNTSSVTWGTWSFQPESGDCLIPEDGALTVQVSVVAPDEQNALFDAYLRVENKNDSTDYELIPVMLKTPAPGIPWWTMLYQLLLRFSQKHQFIEKLWDLIY